MKKLWVTNPTFQIFHLRETQQFSFLAVLLILNLEKSQSIIICRRSNNNNFLSAKPCMLFYIQPFATYVVCRSAINRVGFVWTHYVITSPANTILYNMAWSVTGVSNCGCLGPADNTPQNKRKVKCVHICCNFKVYWLQCTFGLFQHQFL